MKKNISRFLCLVILLVMPICGFAENGNLISAIDKTAMYMYQSVSSPTIGAIGGDWLIMGLARSGAEISTEYYDNYFRNAEKYVKDRGGILHDKKNTEYARASIALTAIGKDPADVGGYNLLMPLADFEKTTQQGINGPVWALIALDCGNYEIPKNTDAAVLATREMYLNYILDNQLTDGGWSLSGDISDIDVTAMVLQALSKYQSLEPVSAAADKALAYISAFQNENGGFTSWGTENSESSAQILVALCELKVPFDDPRFTKNGNTVLDNIMSYYIENTGFKHADNDSIPNQMATEQCFYALVAANRFLNGANSLYDMSDAAENSKSDGENTFGLSGKNPDIKKSEVVAPTRTFSDILGHSSQTAVEELASRNIINGKNADEFDPNSTMTRAEFAAIITRGLQLPFKHEAVFDDIQPTDWYFEYINTAYFYEIIKGVSEKEFNPNGTITREEAAVMLARAARLCGIDTSVTATEARDILSPFSDYITVSAWAADSLAFCCSGNIISDEELELKPKDYVKRAEIAQMLYNTLAIARLL